MYPSNSACFSHLTVLALGSVFSISMPARGQGGTDGILGYPASVAAYDSREIAMLPPYCINAQGFRSNVPGGNDPTKISRWESIMGKATSPGTNMFSHIHHYCLGLMKTNRALILATTRKDREFYLSDSIGEFDYVIRLASSDFVLLPEILTKKGENLIHLGRIPLGVNELKRAIELKPDYWPPYAQMSDYFKAAGELKNARDVLLQGLSHAPDAKALQRRLTELDAAKGKASAAAKSEKTVQPAKPRPEN